MSLAVMALSAFSRLVERRLGGGEVLLDDRLLLRDHGRLDAELSLTCCTSAFFFSARAVEAVISCSILPDFPCATTSTFSFSLQLDLHQVDVGRRLRELLEPRVDRRGKLLHDATFLRTYTVGTRGLGTPR